jgi:hypothetical protein
MGIMRINDDWFVSVGKINLDQHCCFLSQRKFLQIRLFAYNSCIRSRRSGQLLQGYQRIPILIGFGIVFQPSLYECN